MFKFIKWIFRIILVIFSFFFSTTAIAADGFEKENFYNQKYCKLIGGEFNVYHRVKGATNAYVDCETSDTVYEGEWATKSYEAVGQALWYSTITGKRPGILFYVKKEKHLKYVERARRTLDMFGIEYNIIVHKLYEDQS